MHRMTVSTESVWHVVIQSRFERSHFGNDVYVGEKMEVVQSLGESNSTTECVKDIHFG
jgi:hypothetical protein